jgi:hypothetical protein
MFSMQVISSSVGTDDAAADAVDVDNAAAVLAAAAAAAAAVSHAHFNTFSLALNFNTLYFVLFYQSNSKK